MTRRDEQQQGIIILSEISSPAPSGSITLIRVNTTAGMKTIWDKGVAVSPPVQIPLGTKWELYVYYTVYSPVGYWAASISEVASGIPTAYLMQAKTNRYISAGTVNDYMNFEMGAMPQAAVPIRIRLFTTDYFTTQLPPQDQW